MICVTSSQAQSGKSVVAANLAFELARSKRVCLVDADFHNPSQHVYFSITTAPASITALCRLIEQDRLAENDFENLTLDLVVPGATVTLVAGIPNHPALESVTQASFETLVEMLNLKFDEVIFDLSTLESLPSPLETFILERSQRILATCLADPVSVQRFLNSLETFSQAVDFEKCQLVLNRVRSSVLGNKAEAQLTETFSKHSPFQKCVFIAEDPTFDTAMQQSVPLRFANKKSLALAAFENLCDQLVTKV